MTTTSLRLAIRRNETVSDERGGRRVEISVRVPTDLDAVEEAVDLLARHSVASGVAPRAARFNFRVALCEALANAIVYGNRLDPSKRVDVRVVVTTEDLEIHVHDEGDGFDFGDLPDPTTPERLWTSKGRGLFLIRQLVDEVRFNDRGNAICMIMRHA